MRILIINTYVLPQSKDSYPKRLNSIFCDEFLTKFYKNELEILNLVGVFISRLDRRLIAIFSKFEIVRTQNIAIKRHDNERNF
ncbi:MAG: hypothetical protein LUC34_06285 [Campylobacter sp.]|nr:hypothetical protein [Campylobacter sp.]